jgi:tetratricopeptide (TPR) repeat protein
MFFKRQPKESPDELANRLQREGRIEQLEQELGKYSPRKLGPKDRESYYHLWGITAFRRGDRPTAFARFKQGLEACPDSAVIRFALGQEYEFRRQTDEMFACFDACTFPHLWSRYVLAAARYAYLWGRPEKGVAYLQPIADAYFELRIADDHFVYVRGLPFFAQTWSYLVAFAWMQNSYDSTDELLARAKARLSDYDFEPLETFYIGHKQSDYTSYIVELDDRLKKHDSRFPTGYLRTQLAALRVVQERDPEMGLSEFDNIVLAKNDFAWLAEIALAHKARAYWKSNRIDEEQRTRTEFVRRQPLLFEPDHAFVFAFLDYQERLRAMYQSSSPEWERLRERPI